MTEHLEQALRVARRERTLVALLFIDLDDFKEVNDRWGHAVGDDLLRSIAVRLSGVLRDDDLVARLSGDEFTVTLTGLRDRGYVDVVAQKVLDALTAPHDLDGRSVRVSASVGAAVFPTDATHATELLMLADTAMYRAKTRGKDRFEAFAR
jgi:diguanylate cyclase (GGDEF)-like protein